MSSSLERYNFPSCLMQRRPRIREEMKAGEFRCQLLLDFAEMANLKNMTVCFPSITSVNATRKASLMTGEQIRLLVLIKPVNL